MRQRQAAQLVGEITARAIEVGLVGGLGDLEHAVVHDARARYENRDDPPGIQSDEFDSIDHDAFQVGREHQAHVVRELRQLARRLGEEIRDLTTALDHRGLDRPRLAAADARFSQHLIDIDPVGPIRRHAPRRGVRLLQQPALLQLRHDVTDRCGRQIQRRSVRDRFRGDRLAGQDVLPDDRAKHFSGAIIELAHPPASSAPAWAPAVNAARMKPSRSPSSTRSASPISNAVRWSLTMR